MSFVIVSLIPYFTWASISSANWKISFFSPHKGSKKEIKKRNCKKKTQKKLPKVMHFLVVNAVNKSMLSSLSSASCREIESVFPSDPI